MRPVADDVFQLPLLPRDGVNVYLAGTVLIDAGLKQSAKKIIGAFEGRGVSEHVLTHAHIDHAGSSKAIVEAFDGVPVGVGAADVEATESGEQVGKPGLVPTLIGKLSGKWAGVKVTRVLKEGDEVGPGFTVLDVPGHSPGHVAFWRESDRLLIAGDVFVNMSFLTTAPGLGGPPGPVTVDVELNRQSMRKLAALEPATVCFGHGPVLRDAAPKLHAFVAKLKS